MRTDRNATGLLYVALIVRLSGDQWLSRDEIAESDAEPDGKSADRESEREGDGERRLGGDVEMRVIRYYYYYYYPLIARFLSDIPRTSIQREPIDRSWKRL